MFLFIFLVSYGIVTGFTLSVLNVVFETFQDTYLSKIALEEREGVKVHVLFFSFSPLERLSNSRI